VQAAGEEIVRAGQKSPDHANPLVPGSSPGGPISPVSQFVYVRVCGKP